MKILAALLVLTASFASPEFLNAQTFRNPYRVPTAQDPISEQVQTGLPATSNILSASATALTAGQPLTLTATVMAGATAVTPGQVNFCDATAAYCTDIHLLGTAQLTSSGSATLKFIPAPGSHSYKAVFLGTTADAGGASNLVSVTVSASGSAATVTTIAQSGVPGDYTLTATVTGAGTDGLFRHRAHPCPLDRWRILQYSCGFSLSE